MKEWTQNRATDLVVLPGHPFKHARANTSVISSERRSINRNLNKNNKCSRTGYPKPGTHRTENEIFDTGFHSPKRDRKLDVFVFIHNDRTENYTYTRKVDCPKKRHYHVAVFELVNNHTPLASRLTLEKKNDL